jgi:transcriptional regulator with XRE-family HTH domain
MLCQLSYTGLGAPSGIRTRAAALKGQSPGPLDDGGKILGKCQTSSYDRGMPNSLTEQELEWRVAVGARVGQAIKNAELTPTTVAALIPVHPSLISRYIRGLRKIEPTAMTRIATICGVTVDALLDVDGDPLPPPTRTGRCRNQFALEDSGPRHRIMMLQTCDKPEHDDDPLCHDPRGFSWQADPSQLGTRYQI